MKKPRKSSYHSTKPKCYKIYNVSADNECLFNAIAYGVLYHFKNNKIAGKCYKDLAKKLRKRVVEVFEEEVSNGNKKFIERLCCEYIVMSGTDCPDDAEDNSYQKEYAERYIEQMKKKSTWGGSPEVHALTKYIHRRGFKGIKVYEYEDGEYKVIKSMCTKSMSKNKYPHINLLLHGVKMGGLHFDFMVGK